MKKSVSVGGVVVRGDQVLVVNQRSTSWSLPKGHVKEGENKIDTAKREIYEESGIIDLKLIKKLGKYQRYKIGKNGNDDRNEFKTIFMFLFSTQQKDLKPIDPHIPEAIWISKNKVAELLTHPKDKEFYLGILDKF